MPGELPEHVRRFIVDHVDSVELIDVMLLLKRSAGAELSAEDVSRRLCTSPASAANRLEALRASSIAAARDDAPRTTYRYAPATADLQRAVDDLEREYGARRTRVINLVFSKPNDKIRTFADAFKIREED
jgi:hypothetical protein